MDIKKLGAILTQAGIVGLIGAFFWWGIFYVEVVRSTGGKLGDVFNCLYSSSGICAFVAGGAQFIGKTPYTPIIFWSSVAALVLGIVLIATSQPSTEPSEDTSRSLQSFSALRKCPFCAESVKAEAKICRYCQKDLPALSPAESEVLLYGLCPNCETKVSATAAECSNAQCKVVFGSGSAWKIKPLPKQYGQG